MADRSIRCDSFITVENASRRTSYNNLALEIGSDSSFRSVCLLMQFVIIRVLPYDDDDDVDPVFSLMVTLRCKLASQNHASSILIDSNSIGMQYKNYENYFLNLYCSLS